MRSTNTPDSNIPTDEEGYLPGCEDEDQEPQEIDPEDDEGMFFESGEEENEGEDQRFPEVTDPTDTGMFFESSAEAEGLNDLPFESKKKKTWNGEPSPTTYMPFGRYTEEPLEEIPGSYLGWATSEIPQEFYELYLPRFTHEAQGKYLAFWNEVYNGFYNTIAQETGFETNDELTKQVRQAVNENLAPKGTQPATVKPVKMRKNCFLAKGTLDEIVALLGPIAESAHEENMEKVESGDGRRISSASYRKWTPYTVYKFREVRILHVQQKSNGILEVQYLQRNYEQKC